MHQSSSRYLRTTEDKRLFARDFMHLFSTLMISLKLSSHRIHFMRYHHTFTSEEAIENLESLKFSQSNWMPDPKDTSRALTMITTTTFLMDEGMASSVFQQFVDAHLVKNVHGRGINIFPLKDSLYQITPKGLNTLQCFCQRKGIEARHVMVTMKSSCNTVQLINLERNWETDKLSYDTTAIEVIFCRFVKNNESEINRNTVASSWHSSNGHSDDLGAHTTAKRGLQHDNAHSHTFTGDIVVNWLLNCSTTIDLREACSVAELFVQYNLIMMVKGDRALNDRANVAFQPSKHSIYCITDRGNRICGRIPEDMASATTPYDSRAIPGDSNDTQLNHILQDPALRLIFREFLRRSLCEENLSFYFDVSEFTANYHKAAGASSPNRADWTKETLAMAYASGSPCELNIDHDQRTVLAICMTKAAEVEEPSLQSLREVVRLFQLVQTSAFKLMAYVSHPNSDRVSSFMNF